jgi:ElaB/YqjD/DUF883 family membrane-anchored ribosome-binding protein
MNKEELQDELENFRGKLDINENVDENLKKNLTKLIDDINKFLENSEEASMEERENLTENLKDTTLNFETKHPELSESINIIIHTLSNMGI